jgi:hypothetical protein
MPKESLAVACNDINNIKNNLAEIKTDIKDIKETLDARYITKEEFDPIKKIVYGLVGIMLTAIALAIVKLVVLK